MDLAFTVSSLDRFLTYTLLQRVTNKDAVNHTLLPLLYQQQQQKSLTVQCVSLRWHWTLEKDRKKKVSYRLNFPVKQAEETTGTSSNMSKLSERPW